MSDETTEKPGKTWLYVVGTLVGILSLYVLGSGPAIVMYRRGVLHTPINALYGPLDKVLADTGLHGPFEVYLGFWMKLTGTPSP